MNRPLLREESYRGIAGDFVNAIKDHTEADPAGLLISFLVFAGNVIGRRRFVSIGATKHYPNLFCLLVGPTSAGRKGTAISEVKTFFKGAFAMWAEDCLRSGLSSGEGVIHDLRDAEPDQDDFQHAKRVILERPPIEDRRRLYEEPEFGRLLSKNQAKGSILSPVLRSAWDSEDLSNVTKSPQVASDPHISIAAAITAEELTLVMPENDRYNGFINRFGIVWVERADLIPIPTLPERDTYSELRSRLRQALETGSNGRLGRGSREVQFADSDAVSTWGQIYRDIESDNRELGEFFSRFSPTVRRVAMIYATLDSRITVSSDDLLAAKGVVDYFRDSVEMVFGTIVVNRREQRILEGLREVTELSAKELYGLFHGHIKKSELERATTSLVDKGLILVEKREGTGTKGTHIYSLSELGRERLGRA